VLFRSYLDKRTGLRTDHTVNATLDFTYRLASEIESLGVGYGVYAGSGGFANRVWTIADPAPSAAFQYGYADIEVGGRVEHVHLSGGAQVIAGVGPNGFGMGGEGRVRIGDRDGTNLSLIGRTIDQVGFLTDIRFATRPARPLMVGLSVGATNQPNRGDVAVKLGVDAEILTLRNVSLILKTSWQGRTTEHGGLGGGGGLGFYW
jgi:hypothetical protein